MSIGIVHSAALNGLEVRTVRVEADLGGGLPLFHMVGYLASEVKEAGERVRTAVKNAGVEFPVQKIIVNLSPGNVRKKGTAFDLPVALAVLSAAGEIPISALEDKMAVGELGLDGSIRPVPGILPVVWKARDEGFKGCIIPWENREEGALVEGIAIYPGKMLGELCGQLKEGTCRKYRAKGKTCRSEKGNSRLDFKDVRGQVFVKRAVEIAVAGGHNLLLTGPPGSGKSMIASRIPTILPPLLREEELELTKIYSIRGMLKEEGPLIKKRPFREVHHTITKAALIGGGIFPGPGEISLAHKGVLFLDELTEFPKAVLEVLREPLEEKKIRMVRKGGAYEFPADFMLTAATNLCPCGAFPDMEKCTCTPAQIQRYQGRLSQPFLSRIDICMDTPAVSYQELRQEEEMENIESSADIRKRVCNARDIQRKRYEADGLKGIMVNAQIPASAIERYCALDKETEELLRQAFSRMGLTARTCHRTLKVARTIADLEGAERIGTVHLKEAIGYRMPDSGWRRAGI